MDTTKRKIMNIGFLLGSAALVFFLLRAPEVKTPRLPMDDNHKKFHEIKSKKEAEKFCKECHTPNGTSPLSKDHPERKQRCLFCHKR